MKRIDNLSPSTIRHRHGALARCFDWVCRRHPEVLQANPLRLLKRGFATYTGEDVKHVAAIGGKVKVDVERNRRLDEDEEERILAVLEDFPEARMFFLLALETAMRMRECYTIGADQVSLTKKTIHLDRTKNGDGREVPMSSIVYKLLVRYLKVHAEEINKREGRLFPFWNGNLSVAALDATTSIVSFKFSEFFDSARLEDFRFHDLRHEATCRLYEKTTLSDVLIAVLRDIVTFECFGATQVSAEATSHHAYGDFFATLEFGSSGRIGSLVRLACLGAGTSIATMAGDACRRLASVSFAICKRKNASTSSRKNTHDFPIRVPGSSPRRAYCSTVVDAGRKLTHFEGVC